MLETINVLVLTQIGEENFERIKAISPRLRVTDASHLMPDFPPKNMPLDPAKEKQLEVLLANTEVIFGATLPRNVIANSPRIRWIQTMSTGVDGTLTPDIVASPVAMTNSSGVQVVPVSELAFTLILMFAKSMPLSQRNQLNKKWETFPSAVLDGKTLGILGLGNIGRKIARLGKAFGMRVVATRRHIRKVSRARDVDVVYPREQLGQLLAECDYIINILPNTPETDRIIGEKEFGQMKPTAFLVNIGRGKTIDEEALIRALREKRIAGAGLDTFHQEPLPPESPFWELPNVILTSHRGGRANDFALKNTTIFCENLKRYVEGKRLMNIVDKKLKY